MSLHRVPKLSVEKLPPEWGRMPERLILPLEQEIRLFRAALEHTHQYDYRVEDFLEEILIYVRASFIDVESFEDFLHETQRHYPEDARVLVPALERLGKSLLRELHLCGAYTSDGLLHYRFGGWIHNDLPFFVPDIVLR